MAKRRKEDGWTSRALKWQTRNCSDIQNMTMMPERQPEKKAISICHFRFHLGRLWLFWDWDFFLVVSRMLLRIFSSAEVQMEIFSHRNEMIKRKSAEKKFNDNSACCHVCSRFSPRTSRRDMKAEDVLKGALYFMEILKALKEPPRR